MDKHIVKGDLSHTWLGNNERNLDGPKTLCLEEIPFQENSEGFAALRPI
jgi:hypothetical protein